MLCAFAVIYVITYSNIENYNDLKLDNISSNVLRYMESRSNNNIIIVDSSEYIQSFSIFIDKDGNPTSDNSFGDVTNDLVNKAVNLAQLKGDNSERIVVDTQIYKFSINSIFAQIDRDDARRNNKVEEESIRQITFLNITDSQKMLSKLLINLILVAIFMLFIIFIISVYFAKRAVEPIEESYTKQKQFIQDASHELKTPIASINANLGALISNAQETVASQEKWIGYINYETERMNKLVNDLLHLARTDNIQIYTESKPFNISDTISHYILSMETIAYEKGLKFTQNIEPNIIINSDKDKVEHIIKILLDNAIKYVNDNGCVDIRLKQRKNQAILSITNTGEGIAQEHIEKIFDRFYRVDTSRKHSGSYGLGLSIAKALAENIGSDISVTSIPNEKTTFTVKLNKLNL